ncbi:hypothetical protein LBMAG49_10770 [Planctomycetota bacterium]|nr:hypothetical protein LBMAG49_10770 [Planctomycetota bacterium]
MNALTMIALGIAAQQDPNPPTKKTPMPVPLSVACQRSDRQIVIDGSLLDWPELPAIELGDQRQLSGTAQNAWRGPKDLAAVGFFMWDHDSLYFACTVKDDWHRALDAQTLMQEIPVADSILLSIDVDRNTRKLGRNRERIDDADFWLAQEDSHKVMKWDRLRGSSNMLEKGRQVVVHDKESGITTYEMQIPWSDILAAGHAPAAGLVLDINIVVNDFDEGTDPLPQTRIGWTFGCADVIDPGLYGSVMLIDEPLLQSVMPEFPPKLVGPAPLEAAYWDKIYRGFAAHPPVLHDGKDPPESTGGIERLLLLEQLEREIADYPRIDFVELQARIHRRMSREVAGISLHGVPFFWLQGMLEVEEDAKQEPPAHSVRIFRLPQSGWGIRAPILTDSCLVDVAGMGIPDRLWGLGNFLLLTQPIDMTRRNDQLLLRLAASKDHRPFLSHIAFHLPFVDMKDMPLVEAGKSYVQPGGVKVTALGHSLADGSVPLSFGYRVGFPGGPVIVFSGAALRTEDYTGGKCDALVLSPTNLNALAIARIAEPSVVIIDEVFMCSSLPNTARTSLALAHTLQKALLPLPSVLLGPAESWLVKAAR